MRTISLFCALLVSFALVAQAEDEAPRIIGVKARTPYNKEKRVFENGIHMFKSQECVPFRIGPADGLFWVLCDKGNSAYLCCLLGKSIGQPRTRLVEVDIDEIEDPAKLFQGAPAPTTSYGVRVPYNVRKAQKEMGNHWIQEFAIPNWTTLIRYGGLPGKCFGVQPVRTDPKSGEVIYKKRSWDISKKPKEKPEGSSAKVALEE